MAQTSWPFENVDTSETQFSQWARNIGEGIKKGTLDELEVFADSTGMRVKVRSGQALIRGHYYQSNAQEIVTIAASDPTNPRIDIIILELDPSANNILLKAVTGTAAASPTAPSVVQTDEGIYQIKIAEVAVAAAETTIAAEDVTDFRAYLLSPDQLQPLTPSVNAKTGAYTLTADDRGEFITCDGTFTITIPSATFSAGDRVDFVNIGTGVITFVGDGVTVNSVDAAVTIDTQFAGATFFFTSSIAGVLIGKLA